MAKRRTGRLFYKLLFLLLVVSLGPLALAGYYMLNLSGTILKRSAFASRQSLCVGLTDTVYNYVTSFRNVLVEAARSEEVQSGEAARQRAALERLMQTHASLLELSVFNAEGAEAVRLGRFIQTPPLRNFADAPVFLDAMKNGEYMGSLERFMGQFPAFTLAVRFVDGQTGKAGGILCAKLSLNGLSSILQTSFPETSQTQAAVIAQDGFLIAHSDMKTAFKPNAKLPREVLDVLLRNPDRQGSGEIPLEDGSRALGAFAEVEKLGWLVYIQEPMTEVEKAKQEMLTKSLRASVFVVAFVLFLSYLVSLLVVQPVQALSEAAIKVGEGRFEDLPEPSGANDEIGELSRAFNQMGESLRIKTAELLSAQDEMGRLNRSLESRVEARTRELKTALDELIKKERLAAIGQMASVVGHEIRNPLAVINNSIYFVKTKLAAAGEVEPKVAKHISIIESEIQQANGIISEILGFARTRELMLKPQSLNDYLREILSSYPLPANIELATEFSPENPWVEIDAEEMKQAVRNIIGNAVEVMPAGGRLSVSTRLDANTAAIVIADTGPGIPKDAAEKIFNPFFTTKARGTGLGLAVVKKVIERHRGKVELETAEAKGSAFTLYIPVSAPQRAA